MTGFARLFTYTHGVCSSWISLQPVTPVTRSSNRLNLLMNMRDGFDLNLSQPITTRHTDRSFDDSGGTDERGRGCATSHRWDVLPVPAEAKDPDLSADVAVAVFVATPR